MLNTPARIALGLCAALFVVFAALQLNDPDPVQWTAMYLAAAVASGIAAFKGRLDYRVPLAVMAVAILWAAADLPEVWGHKSFIDNMRLGEGMRDPQTEVSREFGGLLIVAAVMTPLAIAQFRHRVRRT